MVYVLIADGFEEAEALLPVDILRRSGIEVKTVGIKLHSFLNINNKVDNVPYIINSNSVCSMLF